MKIAFNSQYPSVEHLRNKARKRIPGFAFEYLDGGANELVNLRKNTDDIRQVELAARYLDDFTKVDLSTELFGHTYAAPYGIAPIGLQGLVWPHSPEILARTSVKYNIPFILSTVSTADIESIAKITDGKAWFQLYHPARQELTDDILKRAHEAGFEVLVILADVPSFGYRALDIKNGLSMPPKMSLRNMLQIVANPGWALNTLKHGQPSFKTLKPYMSNNLNLSQLGKFMDDTFSGRLNKERIARLRDMWKGKLVLKGIGNPEDVGKAIEYGLDGVIVSNHGGRQLDAGPSAIKVLKQAVPKYKDKITIMMDSGIRTGPDIAAVMAEGADFTFMGRTFMYGVAALGNNGGDHVVEMINKQLTQVMDQVGCDTPRRLPEFLMK